MDKKGNISQKKKTVQCVAHYTLCRGCVLGLKDMEGCYALDAVVRSVYHLDNDPCLEAAVVLTDQSPGRIGEGPDHHQVPCWSAALNGYSECYTCVPFALCRIMD